MVINDFVLWNWINLTSCRSVELNRIAQCNSLWVLDKDLLVLNAGHHHVCLNFKL